jgi:hypothetical protein
MLSYANLRQQIKNLALSDPQHASSRLIKVDAKIPAIVSNDAKRQLLTLIKKAAHHFRLGKQILPENGDNIGRNER